MIQVLAAFSKAYFGEDLKLTRATINAIIQQIAREFKAAFLSSKTKM